jgi:hypothetical protein
MSYLQNMNAEMPIVHDTPHVTMSADVADGTLIIRWKSYAPSGSYREILNLAVEWMQKYHLHSFLTDQRSRGPILHVDEQWVIQEWVPHMVAAGLQRAAVVQSPDFFNAQAVERVVKNALPMVPMPIMNFPTLEEAMAWMANGDPVLA